MEHQLDLAESLHDSGHRLTLQRESVLAVIARSRSHLTAEEILKRVRAQHSSYNKSTVYRNLDTLVKLGIVTQTDLGHGHVEYELHRHPHHHHLICRECNRMQEIDHALFVGIEDKLSTEYGFEANLDHFAIFGLCDKCRTSPRSKGKLNAYSNRSATGR